MVQLTRSQLAAFAPRVKFDLLDTYVDAINQATAKYGINQNIRRLRYFLAQSYHETQGYTKFVEVMNYTAPSRLLAVWPSRFTMNQDEARRTGKGYAPDYVNNPEKLANFVYANRADLGNGSPESGDGWKFRGRGAFHLTGRANYLAYSQRIYGDDRILQNPDLVAQPKDAFMSAADYWNGRQYVQKDANKNIIKRWSFNELADADQFTFMCIAIQGSDQSVQERLAVLRLANKTITG